MSKPLSIDKAVDKHLKPVKDSDGTMTALEISTNTVRVKDLTVTGTISSPLKSVNDLVFEVGGDVLIQATENGTDGNTVNFATACAGFIQKTGVYDATTSIVDFRHSNKYILTFGAGNITSLVLYFPLVSGNFTLLLKQDGTGSRTITNYKMYESDGSLADGAVTVKFAGGSNPTLTTDANHVDILSFYWDATNEIAYGVASLDFQF